MRILLVEDDSVIAAILKKALSDEHYAVDIANDGDTGWQLISASHYDLVILDVVLPKINGLELCRRLRDRAYNMPVLLVTALDSSTKKIAGLNAGADDYITKPFELEELLARVRVLLRRVKTSILLTLEWGHLRLWANSREVKYKGNVLNLTPKEYVLLELFLRNPSQVFSRRAILDNLWNESEAPGEETVTSHMKGLRRKLSNAGAPTDFIETVYGVGYRLKPIALSTKPEADVAGEMPAAYCMPHHGPAEDAPKENDPEAEKLRQQKTEVALATLWSSVKYQQIKRLNLLKQLFSQLRTGQISVELRQELQQRAYRIAHGLTGVLGIFGLSAGSDLTREMQELLQEKEPIAQPQQARFKVLIESLETLLHKEVQLSEQATKRPDIPLLVLVDPQLEITPALVRMLWERGLTVKILPHLNVLHSLYNAISTPPKEIQRAHKIEKFNKTEKAHKIENINTTEKMTATPLRGKSTLPDVMLLNFSLSEAPEDDMARLSQLVHELPDLMLLICSADGTLKNRVKASQLGNCPFLCSPAVADIAKAVEKLKYFRGDSAATLAQPPARKIMVVDDDPQVLQALRARLEPQGFQLTTLSQSFQFWQTLQAANPDLLLLDISMPDFSGIELCQAVRQAPVWSHLPIVFFTSHADAHVQQAAFRAGANDLIEKSSPHSELLSHLHDQLKRSHLQQAIAAIADGTISASL